MINRERKFSLKYRTKRLLFCTIITDIFPSSTRLVSMKCVDRNYIINVLSIIVVILQIYNIFYLYSFTVHVAIIHIKNQLMHN
jgi:hypothetical protein